MNLKINPKANKVKDTAAEHSKPLTISAPPSKSYTHRAIIMASLACGKSLIENPLLSGDTLSSVNACRAFGANIKTMENGNSRGDNRLEIEGNCGAVKIIDKKIQSTGNSTLPPVIDIGNSGTTLRIMTSVAALANNPVIFDGDDSIRRRPMGPLLDALTELGAEVTSCDNQTPPVSVSGPLTKRQCGIRGDVSSQFISGLLIAAPLLKNGTEINLTTELKSAPYIDITINMLKKFGIDIDINIIKNSGKITGFNVPGNQMYKPVHYVVEGDFSSAAFIMCYCAILNKKIIIKNLFADSKQGDKFILDIIKEMGACVEIYDDHVAVSGTGSLSGIDVDLSQCPDLVPVVSVLAAEADGVTTLRNIEHVRFKESDRVHAMACELGKMGARVEEYRDRLVIHGSGAVSGAGILSGAKMEGYDDHRIVMALSIAAAAAGSPSTISGAGSIKISYPGFVDVMNSIGGNFIIEQ